MPELQTSPLVETFVEALETMAFIALLPADDTSAAPPDARLLTIDFTRPNPGKLQLLVPASFGHLLSANLLGVDVSDPEAQAGGDDALCELVNVTCGSLLHRFADTSIEPFKMSLPRLQPVDAAAWATFAASAGAIVLDAEGHTLAIRVEGVD